MATRARGRGRARDPPSARRQHSENSQTEDSESKGPEMGSMMVVPHRSSSAVQNSRIKPRCQRNTTVADFVQQAAREHGWTPRSTTNVLIARSVADTTLMTSLEAEFEKDSFLILPEDRKQAAERKKSTENTTPQTSAPTGTARRTRPQKQRRSSSLQPHSGSPAVNQNAQLTDAVGVVFRAFLQANPDFLRSRSNNVGTGAAGDYSVNSDASNALTALSIAVTRDAAASGNASLQHVSSGGGISILYNNASGSGSAAGNGTIVINMPGLSDDQLRVLNDAFRGALHTIRDSTNAERSTTGSASSALLSQLQTAFGSADVAAQVSLILSSALDQVQGQRGLADAIRHQAERVSPQIRTEMRISELASSQLRTQQDINEILQLLQKKEQSTERSVETVERAAEKEHNRSAQEIVAVNVLPAPDARTIEEQKYLNVVASDRESLP